MGHLEAVMGRIMFFFVPLLVKFYILTAFISHFKVFKTYNNTIKVDLHHMGTFNDQEKSDNLKHDYDSLQFYSAGCALICICGFLSSV